jgi:O-antigen ligase
MVMLVGALSYAAESQGAFYPGPFHVFVVLVGVALVTSIIRTRAATWPRRLLTDPLVLAATALVLVTATSSALAGHPADAIGTVTLLLTMIAAVAVVTALRPEERRLLAAGVVVIAVIVAVVGWAAVVARRQPEALTSQGLWRAASTLTYENALAAFLTAPALLCFDRLMTAPARRVAWAGAGYLLLVGIGASLSRGGVLGLVVGIAVLGALRGPPALLRLGPPVAGAVVALACLAPSVPVDSSMHVALAGAGLVVGAVVAPWTDGSRRRRMTTAAAGVAVVGGAIALVSTGHVAGEITRSRLSASSSDRAHEWAAAFDVARHHLLFGVGTARVLLQWDTGGKVFTASFAHNEYLQLLTQDGLAGLLVLLAGLVCVFVRLARLRGRTTAWSAQCGIACLVALLVQSSFDFLWHIPVIPVLMAVVLALSLTAGPALRPRGRGSPPEFVTELQGI